MMASWADWYGTVCSHDDFVAPIGMGIAVCSWYWHGTRNGLAHFVRAMTAGACKVTGIAGCSRCWPGKPKGVAHLNCTVIAGKAPVTVFGNHYATMRSHGHQTNERTTSAPSPWLRPARPAENGARLTQTHEGTIQERRTKFVSRPL